MNKIEWQRKNREARKKQGLCVTCGKESQGFVSCEACRKKERESDKKRKEERVCVQCNRKAFKNFLRCKKCLEAKREKAKSRRKNRVANGQCSSCNNLAKKNHVLCDKCIAAMKRIYDKNRIAIFNAYGNKCASCGESIQEFLQIDHINGGGRKHKRSLSMNFYAWLVKNNFPKGFQILCANCNQEKHQKRKLTAEKINCFNAYGGAICSCCGEKNPAFLEMDHINNDGNIMRKMDSRHYAIYRWLRKHNYPQGYQVLCSNCNWGKRFVDICPHKRKNTNV